MKLRDVTNSSSFFVFPLFVRNSFLFNNFHANPIWASQNLAVHVTVQSDRTGADYCARYNAYTLLS